MSSPDVSVVIATRNREMRLRFALDALREQSLEPDRFEVIVVRAEDTEGPLVSAPAGLDVRFFRAPPGAALQRNVGWSRARGKLIAFTDDDCRPAPGWLAALLGADDGNTVLQGRTEPDPDEEHLLHGHARSITITEPSGWFQTCNIAYPRGLLERVGGFDEAFPTAWGEDTDLGLRVCAAGAEHRFVADALAYHAVYSRTIADALGEALRRDTLPMVVARHPQARELLYARLFVRRSHALLLLALAGLALARRAPPLAALALIPYLRSQRQTMRPLARTLPQAIVRLPSRALVDGASIIAVARAAARSRVLVL